MGKPVERVEGGRVYFTLLKLFQFMGCSRHHPSSYPQTCFKLNGLISRF